MCMVHNGLYLSTSRQLTMDAQTCAAIKIQRAFRKRFAADECVISGRRFLESYEIILDKQVYDARELHKNLLYSTLVPHSRRTLTDAEIDEIFAKFDPFEAETHYHSKKPARELPLTPRRAYVPMVLEKHTLNIGFNLP